MSVFRFKQFSCYHDKSVFKIGTDAILLGSWAQNLKAKSILDIGAGTGIISLMQAQKHPNATVSAIEIQDKSFTILQKNIKESPFYDRFSLIKASFVDHIFTEKFDLIVSNPPYFENSLLNTSEEKTIARHTSSLNYFSLLNKSAKLLSEEGKMCLVFPIDKLDKVNQIAKDQGLFPTRLTQVKGLPTAPFKRVLIEYGKTEMEHSTQYLTIEKHRGLFTPEYCELTKDFHPFL